MKSRNKVSKQFFRLCAAALALFWLAAIGFCSAQPLLGSCDGNNQVGAVEFDFEDVEAVSSPTTAARSGNSAESNPNPCDSDPLCIALQTLQHNFQLSSIERPDFGSVPQLHVTSPAGNPLLFLVQSPFWCRAREAILSLTPAVCLSTANLSHAPPVLL